MPITAGKVYFFKNILKCAVEPNCSLKINVYLQQKVTVLVYWATLSKQGNQWGFQYHLAKREQIPFSKNTS